MTVVSQVELVTPKHSNDMSSRGYCVYALENLVPEAILVLVLCRGCNEDH